MLSPTTGWSHRIILCIPMTKVSFIYTYAVYQPSLYTHVCFMLHHMWSQAHTIHIARDRNILFSFWSFLFIDNWVMSSVHWYSCAKNTTQNLTFCMWACKIVMGMATGILFIMFSLTIETSITLEQWNGLGGRITFGKFSREASGQREWGWDLLITLRPHSIACLQIQLCVYGLPSECDKDNNEKDCKLKIS